VTEVMKSTFLTHLSEIQFDDFFCKAHTVIIIKKC